jgi:mRNA-degrading endonuclease RelE of RelBE toxin-antitoxin system
MNYNIIATPKFLKNIKQLMKKYKKIKEDFKEAIETLEQDPFAGKSLGGNIYKLRLKNSDKSKGKSGGYRIIYYVVTEDKKLYLLTIYSKSEIETIHMTKILEIIEEIH